MPTMLVKVQVTGEKYANFEVRSPQEGDSYMEILRATGVDIDDLDADTVHVYIQKDDQGKGRATVSKESFESSATDLVSAGFIYLGFRITRPRPCVYSVCIFRV